MFHRCISLSFKRNRHIERLVIRYDDNTLLGRKEGGIQGHEAPLREFKTFQTEKDKERSTTVFWCCVGLVLLSCFLVIHNSPFISYVVKVC